MKYLPKFGIRVKILLSIFLFLSIFFFLQVYILHQVILSGYENIEQKNMTAGMQRVENLFSSEIINYSIKLSDWSNWDDTYKFIVDKNQAYIDSNLEVASIADLKINFMIFIASGGAIIEEKGFDYNAKQNLEVPKDFHNLLLSQNKISIHKTTDSVSQGIIRLKNGFMLFASKPILTSKGQGPIRGTIVFAKYVNKDVLNSIAQIENSKIKIIDYYSSNLPEDFSEAKKFIEDENKSKTSNTFFIKAESLNSLAGYLMIKDYNGKPAFLLKSEIERPYFILGNQMISLILTITLVIYVLIIIWESVLLHILVITKITNLNEEVGIISNTKGNKARLKIKGNDEFSNLTANINGMLDKIDYSEANLKVSDDELIKDKEQLGQKIDELKKYNQATSGREEEISKLKQRIAELESPPQNPEQTNT